MPKEKLIDIVKSIDSCANARKGTHIECLARIQINNNGKEDTYWLTSRDSNNSPNHLISKGLDYTKFGHFISKNHPNAINLQNAEVGKIIKYSCVDNLKRIRKHEIRIVNSSNLQNHTITIADDVIEVPYQYRNIGEFFKKLQENRSEISNLEKEIKELNIELIKLKEEKGKQNEVTKIKKTIQKHTEQYLICTQQQEDIKNITIYIRKQGEMRYSHIVDINQNHIKTENLFNGDTIIIDGGPGTGKSTTMIHRLAYLTDIFAINEDKDTNPSRFKLNASQRTHLINAITTNKDWMFFSPSQMLKEYLSNAMSKEGLKNTSEKVWNWKDYCRIILQENYKLLETKTKKAPFKDCLNEDTLFYCGADIINELTIFYLNQLRDIKNSLPTIDSNLPVFEWTNIALKIKERFDDSENFTITNFILLFKSLESVYGEDCKKILKDNRTRIKEVTEEIHKLVISNPEIKKELEDIIDDNEDDYDSDDDDESSENELNNLLRNEIEKWLKRYSYSLLSNNFKFSIKHQEFSETILPLLKVKHKNKIQKIGEIILFEQYAKYTIGIPKIMLNKIPELYKKFREHLMKNKFEGCNRNLLVDYTGSSKKSKKLHQQEQSLLIGFINNLVKQIKTTTGSNSSHTYINAYDVLSRPVIGIDEATDFSSCDIYAIESLLHTDYNSLTLCGDMMQRLTNYGLKSWDELNSIVKKPIVKNLKTSYRQSTKMLDIAKQMYLDTIGEKPTYSAFMKTTAVPEPLCCIDEDEFSKIRWISKRIEEVYNAYGQNLPSIAIFVNDKGYIPNFANNLKKSEFFSKNKIDVINGTEKNKTNSKNFISVYPINTVKGMEFDVVFFHNIDNSHVSNEMMKRFIYVGVSRAAFFLGITMSNDNEEVSKYFKVNKDWFKISN